MAGESTARHAFLHSGALNPPTPSPHIAQTPNQSHPHTSDKQIPFVKKKTYVKYTFVKIIEQDRAVPNF